MYIYISESTEQFP